MWLTQKVCKPRESTYSSDHRPTCHRDNQTGRGSRARSTLRGPSSKHFTVAEQNDQGAGDSEITTQSFNIHISFLIQLSVPLATAVSCTTDGDRLHKLQPGTVSKGAITPGHSKLVTRSQECPTFGRGLVRVEPNTQAHPNFQCHSLVHAWRRPADLQGAVNQRRRAFIDRH